MTKIELFNLLKHVPDHVQMYGGDAYNDCPAPITGFDYDSDQNIVHPEVSSAELD